MPKISQMSLAALVIALSLTPVFGMESPDDNPNPFNSIPTELKFLVLSKLKEKELAMVSQVNHEFHDLADDAAFWENLFHENAELAMARKYNESTNIGITRYAVYRETAKLYPRLAELDKLHSILKKPKGRSWKDHYKIVFGAPNSMTFIEKERNITIGSMASNKSKLNQKKKCLIS